MTVLLVIFSKFQVRRPKLAEMSSSLCQEWDSAAVDGESNSTAIKVGKSTFHWG
jgi:hypothetical protein